MLKKSVLVLILAASCGFVHAQSTPAKKELVARILKQQQAGIEAMARSLAEEPAAALWERAANAIPMRVQQDKQESVARDIQADIQKYAEDAVPVVRTAAVRVAPSTLGAFMEEKFTEDELKQVAAMLESPVYAKFQQLGVEMQKVLVDRVVSDTRAQIEPKVRALEETIARRLGVVPGGGESSGGAAPAGAARPSGGTAAPARRAASR